MNDVEKILQKLSNSKFRASFHLKDKDKQYVNEKGIDVIEKHANDFVTKNLKVKLEKDGKQTPYRGHPVFIAQHATATCCRECLHKWHKIPPEVELDERLISYVVKVIMAFINKENLG